MALAFQRPPGSVGKATVHSRSTRLQAVTRTVTTQKDATAELLQGAFKFALQQRLRTHNGIEVDVTSNAFDLMSGRFGGMTVNGKGWRTPLQLTAQSIQVAVGELVMDQSALVFQQKLALKNVPLGSCTLVLSPQDLGNFMVHDIMKGVAAKVVKGQPFLFDPASVQFVTTGPGQGQILYKGHVGSCSGPAYSVSMLSPVHTTANAQQRVRPGYATQHGAGTAQALQRIQVTAKHIVPGTKDQQGGAGTPAAAAPAGDAHEAAVSSALSDLFSALTLNLQGVELSRPRLRLLPAEQVRGRPAAAGATITTTTQPQQPLVLEIVLQLQLKSLPPLNMKF